MSSSYGVLNLFCQFWFLYPCKVELQNEESESESIRDFFSLMIRIPFLFFFDCQTRHLQANFLAIIGDLTLLLCCVFLVWKLTNCSRVSYSSFTKTFLNPIHKALSLKFFGADGNVGEYTFTFRYCGGCVKQVNMKLNCLV